MQKMTLGPLFVDLAEVELTPEDREVLGHPLVGGLTLFARNFETPGQVRALVKSIKQLRTPALTVAVDQEGGRVQRFKTGFTQLPAAHSYGLMYDTDPIAALSASRCAGYLMAAELREVGVDISFAPVLDVATAESAVIGDRAFHQVPEVVAALAAAHIDGMNRAGMAATGKHFPGHGAVQEDSHHCLPCDQRSFDQVSQCDLVPYRSLIARLRGVMTAHVDYASIEKTLPTYSAYWLQEVLRRDLGFHGVIFSDDLSMAGAHNAGDPVQRVSAALAAGCDHALICNDRRAVCQVLDQLVFALPEKTPERVLLLSGRAPDESFRSEAKSTIDTLNRQ